MEEKNIDIKEIEMGKDVIITHEDVVKDDLNVESVDANKQINSEVETIFDEDVVSENDAIDNNEKNDLHEVETTSIENLDESKTKDKINKLDDQIKEKIKELNDLENKVKSKSDELDKFIDDYSNLEKEKNDLQSDVEKIKNLISGLENQKSELEQKKNEINLEIKNQNKEKEYNQHLINDANNDSINIIKNAKDAANNITEGISNIVNELIENFKKEYDSILTKVYEEKSSLNSREIEVSKKEKDAIQGFVDKVNEKLKELSIINNQITERQLKIDNEVEQYRLEKYAEVNTEVESIKNTIKVEHDKMVNFLSEYKKTEEEYFDKLEKVEEDRRDLEQEKRYFKAREKSLENEINEKVKEIDNEKDEQIIQLTELQKEATIKNINLTNSNNSLRLEIGRLRNLKDLDVTNQELRDQNSKLIDKIDDLQSKHLLSSDDQIKIQEYDKLFEINDDLKKQIKDLKLIQSRNTFSEKENNELKDQIERKDEVINNLKDDLDNFKNVPRSERIKAVEKKIKSFDDIDHLDAFDLDTNELEWLSHIKKQAEASGIIFTDRLLKAYHTSVKIGDWSPLVVLAGVSGTGKSELPRQYALHGGMNFLPIAVKPDWDSPQSLFGYYNSIENKFEATELLRALYQMQDSNKMAMILLDEMNLAHVELYFSDLLSKMETKRGAKDYVEYEIDLGASVDGEILKIKDNILWTGTMNEDETTKALSDKVIDRSTLITFPRPTELIGRSNCKNQAATQYLPKELWQKWKNNAINIENNDVKNTLSTYKKAVERINGTMSQLGRNLGHRVWQSIQYYIVNHPDVIANIKNPNKLQQSMQEAFVETIAFKIMPKLRGVETTGDYESIFDTLESEISEVASELSGDFHNARSLPSKIFMWHTAEFLK